MKRTQKSGDKNRTAILRVRVSLEEETIIKRRAKEHGIKSLSKYVRLASMGNTTSRLPDRETLIRLIAELGKIGSNINQIAKAINIRMKTGESLNISQQFFASTLDSIEQITEQVFEILKNGSFRKNTR